MAPTPIRSRRDDETRPAVLVYVADGAAPGVPRAIAAGLEEEGVPARFQKAPDGASAELAHAAALASTLDVGIGVDRTGRVSVHHAKLPLAATPLTGDSGSGRVMGHHAARLVTGTPLKTSPQGAGREEHDG